MDDMIPHNRPRDQTPRYRLPLRFLGGFLWGVSTLRPRSFARDASLVLTGLRPGLEVRGGEQIPPEGPCLVTCNHYGRPGFAAWWLAFSISAAVAAHRLPTADPEIHWVITGAWTFPESPWKRRFLTPLSRWIFARVARMYGFVSMPPMPPDPAEVEARAQAVRQTLRLARGAARDGGMIGLAPEGRDVGPRPGDPPDGAGLFVELLVKTGLPVMPVGVSEQDGRLRLSFGLPYELAVPDAALPSTSLGAGRAAAAGPATRRARDRAVSRQVIDAISQQLE
jgi:1-acyl-sn-glycerol-3-phosphate acyltransferase